MIKVCAQCGVEFLSSGPRVKFCSKRCGDTFLRQSRPPLVRICKTCGREFSRPRLSGGKYRYCSEECRAAAAKAQCLAAYKRQLAKRREQNAARLIVRCAVCGKEFHSPRGTAKYCSPICKYRQNHIWDAERRERRKELIATAAEDERTELRQIFSHRRESRKDYALERLIGLSRNSLDDIALAMFE